MIEAAKWDRVWPLMISTVDAYFLVGGISLLDTLVLGAFEVSTNIPVKCLELVQIS
jgi:hypothetical protein